MSVYRRRIRLVTVDATTVRGDLEDDFHRFGLTLRHDASSVTSVEGDAHRFPWTTCAGAVEPLAGVAGAPLAEHLSSLGRHTAARRNCTHLFDLAGLAIAHAVRGPDAGTRTYDVAVPDRDGGRTDPSLRLDGRELLRWRVDVTTITDPPPFAGAELRGGFLAWAEANLPPELVEPAIVLRRACDISLGRVVDLDGYERASEIGEFMSGTCHSFQPGIAEVGLRVRGQTRDFTDDPDGLLAAR